MNLRRWSGRHPPEFLQKAPWGSKALVQALESTGRARLQQHPSARRRRGLSTILRPADQTSMRRRRLQRDLPNPRQCYPEPGCPRGPASPAYAMKPRNPVFRKSNCRGNRDTSDLAEQKLRPVPSRRHRPDQPESMALVHTNFQKELQQGKTKLPAKYAGNVLTI